jgi:hypothetical protein
MSKVEDGGPAFPQHVAISPSGDVYGSSYYGDGMSLRDWFAGQALAGMIESHGMGEKRHEYAAHDAYRFADAMIAAREGQGGGS